MPSKNRFLGKRKPVNYILGKTKKLGEKAIVENSILRILINPYLMVPK
jgi:hypothetical protein